MARYLVLAVAGLVLAGAPWQRTYGQQPQEVYLDFQYANVVNAVITAQYADGQLYLPVGGLFQTLRIDHSIDPDNDRVTGFYLDQDTTYSINWATGTAEIGTREVTFDTSAVLEGELDVFFKPELFAKFFGLRFSTNLQELSMALETDRTVPRVAAVRRQQERRFRQMQTRPAGPGWSYPSPVISRDESWVDGGVLDYRATGNLLGPSPSYMADIETGLELMGGDIEAGGFAEWANGEVTFSRRDSRWRYVVPGGRVVRQMMVGELRSSGLRDVSYRGIQVTNAPITHRRFFGTYTVQGETEPGWEVELYLDGRLVEVKTADQTGAYTFDVPLTYGSSIIEIQSYGPEGGTHQERRRIELPFEFLPADSVQYSMHVGQNRRTESAIVQSRAGMGFTRWLTGYAGVEYLSDTLAAPVGYTELSARIGTPYVLNTRIVPGVLYRGGISAFYSSNARFSATYTHYAKQGYYNIARAEGRGRATVYVPLSLFGQQASIRLSENAVRREDRTDLRTRIGLSFSLAGVRLRMSYGRTDVGQNFDFGLRDALISGSAFARPDLSFLWPGPGGPGLMLRSNIRYNQTKNTLQTARFGIVRPITSFGSVSFELTRDFERDFYYGGIELSLTFPYTRVRSSSRIRGGFVSFDQSISGSVGWDRTRNALTFDKRGWVGQGAMSVRMYVDENGNSVRDENEAVITEGNLRMRRSAATFVSQGEAVRAHSLQPYEKYAVYIDEQSIPNPRWVADHSAFTARVEPNGYTPIDIPFFVSGIIQGRVSQVEDDEKEPIGGINLHLEAEDGTFGRTVRVFNDGSFYSYEIPPGQYTLRVDSSHLEILDAVPDPKRLSFEVDARPGGDIVDSLRIVLRDREAQPSEQPEDPRLAAESEPAGSGEGLRSFSGYIVQLAAYERAETAEMFANKSRAILSRPVHSRYDSIRQSYIVHLDTLGSQTKARRLLAEIQKMEAFQNAVMRPGGAPPKKNWYALQAGAFRSGTYARQYADSLRRNSVLTDVPVLVTDEKEYHKVLLAPQTSRGPLKQLREEIIQSTDLDKLLLIPVNPHATPRGVRAIP